MQQIVVVKGNCGFGDRLQVLSHAMEYCIKHDAIICIDWRDRMWGQTTLDFKDYFVVHGIKTIELDDVVKLMQNNINTITINPKVWTSELMKDTPDATRELKYNLTDTELRSFPMKINGNIIVFNNQGYRRSSNLVMVNNIKLKPVIQEEIKTRINSLILPCCLIHIRGTDRISSTMSGYEILRYLETNYDMLPAHSKARCYVVTDSDILMNKWINKYPESKPLQNISFTRDISKEDPHGKCGIHMYTDKILNFYNIQKHILNIECLSEFIALSFAENAIGNNNSCFFNVARFINKRGNYDISNWLNGWKPAYLDL